MDNQPNSPVKIEVIQGGMVEKEKSYPPIKHETTDNIGFKHVDGAVSMARGKPGTATSSFFICIEDQPELDYGGKRNPDGEGFAAFGRVLDGMNVVKKIQLQPSEKQRLTPPVQIVTISRI
jgi:peptidyl-prolyl cis-trans isomerase A (cyclophilin A)